VLEAQPNPFGEVLQLSFHLDASAETTLAVYDTNMRLVQVLCRQPLLEGEHCFNWEAGSPLAGMYFVRLSSGKTVQVVRVVRI